MLLRRSVRTRFVWENKPQPQNDRVLTQIQEDGDGCFVRLSTQILHGTAFAAGDLVNVTPRQKLELRITKSTRKLT